MKIYTRTGDKGTTKLLSGRSIEKSDQRLHVYGTTDELNSYLGLCVLKLSPKLAQELTPIQNELFNLGSLVACDDPQFLPNLPPITQTSIERMEKQIDAMTEKLPALKNFIIPGGTEAAAHLHIARTICRRAERELALLKNPDLSLAGIYLNRLSDYLFVFARFANLQSNVKDLEWQK